MTEYLEKTSEQTGNSEGSETGRFWDPNLRPRGDWGDDISKESGDTPSDSWSDVPKESGDTPSDTWSDVPKESGDTPDERRLESPMQENNEGIKNANGQQLQPISEAKGLDNSGKTGDIPSETNDDKLSEADIDSSNNKKDSSTEINDDTETNDRLDDNGKTLDGKDASAEKDKKADVNETKPTGGTYGELKDAWHGELEKEPPREVHHMPANDVNGLALNDGPAIVMEKADHRQTASCGNSLEAREYRAKQEQLIKEGKFKEAMQMDIDDIHAKFGNKYDDAISQMQAKAKEQGLI